MTSQDYAEAYFNECLSLKAEIARLRAACDCWKGRAMRLGATRDVTIEECAKVVEKFDLLDRDSDDVLADVAHAIRALKDRENV